MSSKNKIQIINNTLSGILIKTQSNITFLSLLRLKGINKLRVTKSTNNDMKKKAVECRIRNVHQSGI